MIGDDFSNYGSTADLMAKVTPNNAGGTGRASLIYTDGLNASLAQIDNTVLYNGHATMKYNQPGGTAGSPEMWAALPKSTTKIWLRAHIRFSQGFITTGTLANCANAYKLLGWGFPGYNGSGRLEITNTNQYDLYWGMADRSSGATVGGGDNTHVSPGTISSEWNDGAWYTYIVEVDNSTAAGVTRVYMARGNATPTLRATSKGTMSNGAALPPVNYVFLGMNFNQVRAAGQNQAVWYGDWEVVDGNQYTDPYGLK
jgi:hypothetical protein